MHERLRCPQFSKFHELIFIKRGSVMQITEKRDKVEGLFALFAKLLG